MIPEYYLSSLYCRKGMYAPYLDERNRYKETRYNLQKKWKGNLYCYRVDRRTAKNLEIQKYSYRIYCGDSK